MVNLCEEKKIYSSSAQRIKLKQLGTATYGVPCEGGAYPRFLEQESFEEKKEKENPRSIK